jgi:hypothetical protein
LQHKLQTLHHLDPFTVAIDLTRGSIAAEVPLLQEEIPTWEDFSISRIRQATKPALPTSGHLISHNTEEIRETLIGCDTEHMLILDDTSFSGSTSLIVEELVQSAFPDRDINFTHGFLILNTGDLGPIAGAKRRIESGGSGAIGGMEMHTPRDDGWHFFDIINQEKLPEHLTAVMGLIRLLEREDGQRLAEEFLSEPATQQVLFPQIVTTEELQACKREGRFISTEKLNGDVHVRNPQLLPNIVGQGHLRLPQQWRGGEVETMTHLLRLQQLMEGKDNE